MSEVEYNTVTLYGSPNIASKSVHNTQVLDLQHEHKVSIPKKVVQLIDITNKIVFVDT